LLHRPVGQCPDARRPCPTPSPETRGRAASRGWYAGMRCRSEDRRRSVRGPGRRTESRPGRYRPPCPLIPSRPDIPGSATRARQDSGHVLVRFVRSAANRMAWRNSSRRPMAGGPTGDTPSLCSSGHRLRPRPSRPRLSRPARGRDPSAPTGRHRLRRLGGGNADRRDRSSRRIAYHVRTGADAAAGRHRSRRRTGRRLRGGWSRPLRIGAALPALGSEACRRLLRPRESGDCGGSRATSGGRAPGVNGRGHNFRRSSKIGSAIAEHPGQRHGSRVGGRSCATRTQSSAPSESLARNCSTALVCI
jgi:hypothetical protein